MDYRQARADEVRDGLGPLLHHIASAPVPAQPRGRRAARSPGPDAAHRRQRLRQHGRPVGGRAGGARPGQRRTRHQDHGPGRARRGERLGRLAVDHGEGELAADPQRAEHAGRVKDVQYAVSRPSPSLGAHEPGSIAAGRRRPGPGAHRPARSWHHPGPGHRWRPLPGPGRSGDHRPRDAGPDPGAAHPARLGGRLDLAGPGQATSRPRAPTARAGSSISITSSGGSSATPRSSGTCSGSPTRCPGCGRPRQPT